MATTIFGTPPTERELDALLGAADTALDALERRR